jgi:very-short-patch-repair endonuclease
MSLKNLARALRRTPTDAERKLWVLLRGRRLDGFKFRRQEPLEGFIVDFFCRERGLVVELDGGQHLESPRDQSRTRRLQSRGYRVLRFWDNDVLNNPLAALEAIARELRTVAIPAAARSPQQLSELNP